MCGTTFISIPSSIRKLVRSTYYESKSGHLAISDTPICYDKAHTSGGLAILVSTQCTAIHTFNTLCESYSSINELDDIMVRFKGHYLWRVIVSKLRKNLSINLFPSLTTSLQQNITASEEISHASCNV